MSQIYFDRQTEEGHDEVYFFKLENYRHVLLAIIDNLEPKNNVFFVEGFSPAAANAVQMNYVDPNESASSQHAIADLSEQIEHLHSENDELRQTLSELVGEVGRIRDFLSKNSM